MWQRTSKRKEKLSAASLLKQQNINFTAFLRKLVPFTQGHFASLQFTKKGPGRKHRQGEARYIPREQEYSPYRTVRDEYGVVVSYRW